MRGFHVLTSRQPRPPAGVALYVDGARDPAFRDGVDVELSNWRGNRTPGALKEETTTGVALNHSASSDNLEELVILDHLSVDGILATYALRDPEVAQVHATGLLEAAQVGSFWGWGGNEAMMLYHATHTRMAAGLAKAEDPNATVTGCLEAIDRVMGGLGRDDTTFHKAMAVLKDMAGLVEGGVVQRRIPTPHLAHYVLPITVADLPEALHIPPYDAPLLDSTILSPRVRARFDRERLRLVSVETPGGWVHELWLPGHAWADTPGLWSPDGIAPGANGFQVRFVHPGLAAAAAALQAEEKPGVRWWLPQTLAPFAQVARAGRKYPVVLSTLDGAGQVTASALDPQRVGVVLANAFP